MVSVRTVFVPILLGFAVLVAQAKLPSYITPCKITQTSVSQCVKDNFGIVRSHLKDGIKELHIPVLVPFHLPEVIIDATDNLKIKMENVDIHNLDASEMKEAVVDYIKPNINGKFVVAFEQIVITGTYDIDGQILILPIRGHGPANITVNNFQIVYDFSLEPFKRKGKEYMKITNQHFAYTMDKVFMNLENLFNGDKSLADQVNQFLNDNWPEVAVVLKPAIFQTLRAVIENIFQSTIGAVPTLEFFDWSD